MFLEQFSADELRDMPILSRSQVDNLHFEAFDYEGYDGVRYWVCRAGVADGMPCDNLVTIEILRDGRWEQFDQYPG